MGSCRKAGTDEFPKMARAGTKAETDKIPKSYRSLKDVSEVLKKLERIKEG